MKKNYYFFCVLFLFLVPFQDVSAQLGIYARIEGGVRDFGPATPRVSTYTCNTNFNSSSYHWSVQGGSIVTPSGQLVSYYEAFPKSNNTITVQWNAGGTGYLYVMASGSWAWFATNRSDEISVSLNGLCQPVGYTTISGPNTIYAGNNGQYTYTASASNASAYNWSVSGATIVSQSGNSITIRASSTSGNVVLQARGVNSACNFTGAYTSKTVTRPQAPEPSLTAYIDGPSHTQCYQAATWTAVAYGGNGTYTYRWEQTNGSSGPYYYRSANQSYTYPLAYSSTSLKLIVTSGTKVTTVYKTVTSSGCQHSASFSDDALVYPNPVESSEYLNVIMPENFEKAVIELSNSFGLIVRSSLASSSDAFIDTTGLPKGLYTLSIRSDKGLIQKRVKIE